MQNSKIEDALALVRQERLRQIEKWGDQSDNTLFHWVAILTEEVGELAKEVNDIYFGDNNEQLGGDVVYSDDAYRFLLDAVIEEATQVAAVAAAIIERVTEAKAGVNPIAT